MSGFSESESCPNCGGDCDVYTDYKPFSFSSYQCLHCGLLITPVISYMTLKQLNSMRRDSELPLLRKKPKQEKDLW